MDNDNIPCLYIVFNNTINNNFIVNNIVNADNNLILNNRYYGP